MTFVLSQKSLNKLIGVKRPLVDIVKRAIEITTIDFSVTCGLRTEQEQQDLFDLGKTWTLDSKHLTGDAVDIAALVDGDVNWDIRYYCQVADAFCCAAKELNTSIRWGGAWSINDITLHSGDMKSAMNKYIRARQKQGVAPTVDGPHFELS